MYFALCQFCFVRFTMISSVTICFKYNCQSFSETDSLFYTTSLGIINLRMSLMCPFLQLRYLKILKVSFSPDKAKSAQNCLSEFFFWPHECRNANVPFMHSKQGSKSIMHSINHVSVTCVQLSVHLVSNHWHNLQYVIFLR